MPKRVSRYICDTCDTVWVVASLARLCEQKHEQVDEIDD